jgi:hypothetical protein
VVTSIRVGEDEVDRAIGQLGAHLARGLLGEIHRRLSDGRGKRSDQVIERFFDGAVSAGQRALTGEGSLHRVDDWLKLHEFAALPCSQ